MRSGSPDSDEVVGRWGLLPPALLLLLLIEVASRGGSRAEEREGAGRRARSLLPRKAAGLMDED